jgi:hypothetical protein
MVERMSTATHRKIAQLRALAASTTFPEEAKSARAKADKLEATLGSAGFAGPQGVPPPLRFKHGPESHASDAYAYAMMQVINERHQEAVRQMRERMARDWGLDASDFVRDPGDLGS